MSQRRFIQSLTSDMDRAGSCTPEVSPAPSAECAQHCTAPAPSGMREYIRSCTSTQAVPLFIHGVRLLERVFGREHRAVDAVPSMPKVDSQMRTNVGARAAHPSTDEPMPFVDLCTPRVLLTDAPPVVVTSSM